MPGDAEVADFRTILGEPPLLIDVLTGVSKLLASLGHTGRRRVVLGHTLNPWQHVITNKSHNVLS